MTKENNENFKSFTKCWIFDNGCVDNDDKVRDHYHIIERYKYRGCAHRDCNTNLKLNRKIPIVFNHLKNYDSHLIMQELGKFNLKTNVILNEVEKYMSFAINNMLSFIGSFQYLSSSLDNLVGNLDKVDFKYLSQELVNKALNPLNQKGFSKV